MLHRILRRPGLLLMAAVLLPPVGSLLLATSQAQPPVGPGGSFPRPGSPFGPVGPGGGPGIPHEPSDPFDRTGGLGGRGRMGSLFEHVFSCGKCGKELGRSDRPFDKPPYDKCPYCGVRFINGGHGFSRPGSSFKPSDGQGQQPNFGGGFTPPEQNFPNPGFDNAFNNTPFTGGGDSFDEDEESDPFERLQAPLGRRLLLAAIVGGVGLVVIAGVVGLVFLVSRAGSGSSRPRRRRRARNDDDDDYEDAPRPRSRVRRY